MNFLEKLDLLMYKNKLNKKKLAEQSGVPYTTIIAWYKRGYSGMALPTFQKICDFFNVTMDSMARDDAEIEYNNSTKSIFRVTREEEYFLQCYRSADDMHKGLAQCAVGADEKGENSLKNQNVG